MKFTLPVRFRPTVDGVNSRPRRQGLIAGAVLAGSILIVIGVVLTVRGLVPWGSTSDQLTDLPKLRVIMLVEKDCADCFDMNMFVQALNEFQIDHRGVVTIDKDSHQGRQLIEKYKIERVPTVLVAGDLQANPDLALVWPQLGEIIDGVFVLRQVLPPYIDVATGARRGDIQVTYLTESSCTECYDVMVHGNALRELGITPTETRVVDAQTEEGKQLIKDHYILKTPTIIMTGDVGEYGSIRQLWPRYGEVSDNGGYVFTRLDSIGTYYDLIKKQVIKVDVPVDPTLEQ